MRRIISALLFCAVLTVGATAVAQRPDLEVSEIARPELKWGPQVFGFEIFTNVDYPKFAVTTLDLSFTGTYLNPKRRWKVNTIVIPGEHPAVKIPLDIPVNFGMAQLELNVYDVVDTLDGLNLGTKVMTQTFQLRFKIPDALASYMEEKITFPPMVDNNPLLDNEFVRVMFTMFNEGKTTTEITKLANIDSAFVDRNVNELVRGKYVIRQNTKVTLSFPYLTVKQAETIKPIAEKASDAMAALMAKNMPKFVMTRDSMVKAGAVAKDSNDFLNGGTILYHKYVTVGVLALWYDLGQKFISDSAMLETYKGTDPCNAYVPQYMYAVQGGEVFNGHHYYNASNAFNHEVIQFGDPIPKVKCPDLYPYPTQLAPGSDWSYTGEFQQEILMLDTSLTNIAVRALDEGCASIVSKAGADFKKKLDEIGPAMYTAGTRLWFWNLVASRTLDKMISAGVVAHEGNGQFHLEATTK